MVTPVNNSSVLVEAALNSNESTLIMQCALLQKILEAKAGATVSADAPKKGAVGAAALSGVSPTDDSNSLNPEQQAMVLLGDLGLLDLLANAAASPNAPSWVTTEYNQLVSQINQMLAAAPAGTIDPTILTLAETVMKQAAAPNGGPSDFLQAYESAINNLNSIDPNYPAGDTIGDWIRKNEAALSSSNNMQFAGAIALFMMDIEYNVANKPNSNPALSVLASFWNTSSGTIIPEPTSQAAADFVMYALWVQAGSPAYSNPPSNAWVAFMETVGNVSSLIDPNSNTMPWSNPSGVTPGYSTFYQDLVNNINTWSQSGPPSYSSLFASNFLSAWNQFINS